MTDLAQNFVGILVVEDEALVAQDIRNRLQHIGHTVLGLAFRPNQALALARELKPDLLLCDIHLKDKMDGIEVARQVNDMAETPVVFLTAYSDADTLSRAKSVAPYGYVLKPIETVDLQIAIEMALHRFSLDKEALQSPASHSEEVGSRNQSRGLEARLESALRVQVRHCLERDALQPLSQWLERDLILAALDSTGQINLRAAEMLDMPESTLRRKLLRYQAETRTEETLLWKSVQRLLPDWLHACQKENKNPLHGAQLLLLQLIEAHADRRMDAAILAGVSAPTYRRKVQELN